jgi:hypothetical protein
MKVTVHRVEFLEKLLEDRLRRKLSVSERKRIVEFIKEDMQYWLEPFLKEFVLMIITFVNAPPPVDKLALKNKGRRKLRPVQPNEG